MGMGKITLAAVGDIFFARTTETAFRQFGPDHLFKDVVEDLRQADIRFGNQESVMATCSEGIGPWKVEEVELRI